MKRPTEQRATLARMEAARVETERHLAIIKRQTGDRPYVQIERLGRDI